jgi:hypothetical protein
MEGIRLFENRHIQEILIRSMKPPKEETGQPIKIAAKPHHQ